MLRRFAVQGFIEESSVVEARQRIRHSRASIFNEQCREVRQFCR